MRPAQLESIGWGTPATEPVTLRELKAAIGIDHHDADDELQDIISAARQYAEETTLQAFVQRTMTYTFDRWPPGVCPITLPVYEVASVTSVYYREPAAGVSTEWSSDLYDVDLVTRPATIRPIYGGSYLEYQPYPKGMIVTFVGGYATVPPSAKRLVIMYARKQYDQTAELDELIESLRRALVW